MTTKRKKILTYSVTGLAGAALLAGSLAYFTDYVTGHFTMTTTGGDKPAVEVTPNPDPTVTPDDPTQPPFVDPTPDDSTDDLTNWWKYVNSKALANFNPGDKLTLDFHMDNTGALAVDVRETFILTSSVPLSSAPEFRLFTSYSEDTDGGANGEEVLMQETRIDDTHYQYRIDPFSLSSEDENLSEAPSTKAEKQYYLVFDKTSANVLQGATCQIDYIAEVKQHSNGGEADWITASTAQLTVGGQTLNVVPGR